MEEKVYANDKVRNVDYQEHLTKLTAEAEIQSEGTMFICVDIGTVRSSQSLRLHDNQIIRAAWNNPNLGTHIRSK